MTIIIYKSVISIFLIITIPELKLNKRFIFLSNLNLIVTSLRIECAGFSGIVSDRAVNQTQLHGGTVLEVLYTRRESGSYRTVPLKWKSRRRCGWNRIQWKCKWNIECVKRVTVQCKLYIIHCTMYTVIYIEMDDI